MAFAGGGGPEAAAAAVLLAAAGEGAELLEAHAVMRGSEWAAAALAGGGCARLVVPDAARAAGGLTREFAALHQGAGLRSLAAVAVAPPGAPPLGCLLLGSRALGAFGDDL